jgi:hypothetical protein
MSHTKKRIPPPRPATFLFVQLHGLRPFAVNLKFSPIFQKKPLQFFMEYVRISLLGGSSVPHDQVKT